MIQGGRRPPEGKLWLLHLSFPPQKRLFLTLYSTSEREDEKKKKRKKWWGVTFETVYVLDGDFAVAPDGRDDGEEGLALEAREGRASSLVWFGPPAGF